MITKSYKMRIDFKVLKEMSYDRSRKLDSKIDDISKVYRIDTEIFLGNPACYPYLHAEHDNLKQLQKLEDKLKNLLYINDMAII